MLFRNFITVLVILLKSSFGFSQIIPSSGSLLNYTSVYLEENLQAEASSYELNLYGDPVNSSGALATQSNSLPAFHISALEWGHAYIWRVSAYDKDHRMIHESAPHTFTLVNIETNILKVEVKLDIKTNLENKHAGGLIMVDYTRSIFDRNGNIVWTLPYIEGIVDSVTQIRDLKMTADNTVTFLTPKNAVEIDLDAKVLWKAPNPFLMGNEPVSYHHDLKKTRRGTYMVLGKRKVDRRLLGDYTEKELAKEYESFIRDKKAYRKAPVDLLLEFDKNGKLLWSWDANNYISDEDLAYKKDPSDSSHVFSSHANAFSEDEAGKTVYIGFRDLCRIVKVDKKTKKVLMSYGEKFPSGEGKSANDLFRRQHDATITKRNSILILNNNDPSYSKARRASGIVEFSASDGSLLWSFYLDYEASMPSWSSGGGNVNELPNGNILVCGGVLNRIVEVSRTKEVVWEALVLSRFKNDKSWSPFPQYRASWLPGISRYYFIPYISKTGTANNMIPLVIANTGNASDLYFIEVLSGGKSIYKKTTSSIETGESSVENIFLKNLKGDSDILILIRSEKGRLIKQLALSK